jgi:hypothetical protein
MNGQTFPHKNNPSDEHSFVPFMYVLLNYQLEFSLTNKWNNKKNDWRAYDYLLNMPGVWILRNSSARDNSKPAQDFSTSQLERVENEIQDGGFSNSNQ